MKRDTNQTKTMREPHRDLFRGTAWYYARYRSGYPEAFFECVKAEFHLSKDDRILDLGCGTGQIAIPISQYVKEVVAMEPDPEMLAEGKRQTEESGVSNIVWVEGGSKDLSNMSEELGRFKLVTLGSSFHWMDREKALEDLYDMVDDGGGIVIVGAPSLWTKANEWQELVKKVIQKWLGEERRAGSGVFHQPEKRHEELITQSRFQKMEIWKHQYAETKDLDSVVGGLYSTSFANPSLLGDRREAFEKDLREALLKQNPSGEFSNEVELEAILVWK